MSAAVGFAPDGSDAWLVFNMRPGAYNDTSLIEFLEDLHDLKGPKTPMHGRLQENRRDGGASDVRGGAVDPEEPFIRQAKFLPI